MLEELLKTREVIRNQSRGTSAAESGEVVYGTFEELLPSIVNSLVQLPLILSKLEKQLGKRRRKRKSDSGDQMLRIKDVAVLLGCSYSEARQKMLDGRIKTVKDGRWLRTRKEWVDEYLLAQIIKKPDPVPEEIKIKRPKVKQIGEFKKGGLAYEFLRSRPD